MKKILIFSLAYHPHVGGAEVAVKEITDRIKDFEWHMITLCFDNEPSEEKIGNVHVHRTGIGSTYISKILFVLQAVSRAIELHKKHHFEGIWAMMSYMLIPVVILRMRGLSLPYALTLQEGDTYEHMFNRLRVLPFLPLLSSGFKNATIVQTISNYLSGWARRRGYKENIEVIPNGYDTWWFTEYDFNLDRTKFWKNNGINDKGTILITTSRLVHKNAIDIVIKAMKKLPETVNFVILGNGPERSNLETLATRLGVSGRVHFLGNKINSRSSDENDARVVHYLYASNIFVRPSRSEGMGNSFIEAMAVGLPVIATQEGGIADFLFDEKRNYDKETTGWAVDKDSPEQVAEAVKEILSNKEKTSRVIANAKKMVIEKYDWNLIARNMKERVFNTLFKK